MHALITNLALNYSPDEIDLYLIDFKKGVEFKVYATHELPHASVVAIESEREFGISVLQRLDAEMRLRADRFRDAGVQDLNGYRNAPGTPPLPRILLIVDEFQEFFVEEDKLAQEAALLARPPGPPGPSLRRPRHPRLAEPGRRLHPGPEHARPDGRADRPSVQRDRRAPDPEREQPRAAKCSRGPARRSTTTPTARPRGTTSSRSSGSPTSGARPTSSSSTTWPASGSRSWRARRSSSKATPRPTWRATPCSRALLDAAGLARVAPFGPGLGRRRGRDQGPDLGPLPPPGGQPPADRRPERRGGARRHGRGPARAWPPSSPRPTSDTVRSGARFFVLDGTPEDHPQRRSPRAASPPPCPTASRSAAGARSAEFLADVAAEVSAAQQPDGPTVPSSSSSSTTCRGSATSAAARTTSASRAGEEDASPADQLDLILREGPGLGVHLITWCDTVNNLNRYFTHQQLREFEMRVLFQMSPTDSGHLLDSPARQQARPQPRPLRQRGAEPPREVPPLRTAAGGVARNRRQVAPHTCRSHGPVGERASQRPIIR